jgi:protocatechuate 3,4-dioxygenase beta subunit
MLPGVNGRKRCFSRTPKPARPPLIHFKVAKLGDGELVSQMYFPGHPLNAKDRLLQCNNTEARMTASLVRENPESYRFQIV